MFEYDLAFNPETLREVAFSKPLELGDFCQDSVAHRVVLSLLAAQTIASVAEFSLYLAALICHETDCLL
ncbi:hypothetical protein BRC86_01410 [Halobacteriales archaeon QS_3_64_16]|nr:MAG: hypothetical protein BRC86_01410 [Halobacteriales archaeon QS_3_64_16]